MNFSFTSIVVILCRHSLRFVNRFTKTSWELSFNCLTSQKICWHGEVTWPLYSNLVLQMRMAASESSFEYPPIYNFPPFFTYVQFSGCWLALCYTIVHIFIVPCRIQPSDETRMKQLEQWRKFILHWVQSQALKEAMLVDVHSFPLFKNDKINRTWFPSYPRERRTCQTCLYAYLQVHCRNKVWNK